MARIFFSHVAKCSQMSDPQTGRGSGGNRCTEAVASMIDCTFKIGPHAKAGASPEQVMYEFTEWLNGGKDVSQLEPPAWIDLWLTQHSGGQITVQPGAADMERAKAIVAAGHIAIIGVRDYRKLRLWDGSNPYAWDPRKEQAAGHVLLLVGYDDDFEGKGPTLIVHDPLRGLDGMPWDYSPDAVRAAGWDTLAEVQAPALQPAPLTAGDRLGTYVVQAGDTLALIAEKLAAEGLFHGSWHYLYQLNLATIEAAAEAHHQNTSRGGNLIYPGTVLLLG